MGKIQENEKLAELCGAIIGDGWIQSNEQNFFLAGDPIEDKEYYDKHISKIITELIAPVKPKHFPYWQVYGIGIYNKSIIKKLLALEIPKGKKAKTALVPSWIINSNEKVIKSFLRGLFDADGCVFCQKAYGKYNNEFDLNYHSKIRLRITSISSQLIEDVFLLCKKIGLRITKIKIKGGFRYNRLCNDVHILNINELKSIERWFKEIKPSNSKHTTKYLVWKKHGFCPPYTTIKQRKDILKKNINPYDLYVRG